MPEQGKGIDVTAVSKLLQLESMARAAPSAEALYFIIVNETREILPYRQAYLFLSQHPIKHHCRLVSASSISIIEKNSPFVLWLQKALDSMIDSEEIVSHKLLSSVQCPEELKKEWDEYSLPFVLWMPLKLPDGTFIGGLWVAREAPWQDNEISLLQRLNETYAHALVAVTSKRTLYKRPKKKAFLAWTIVLLLCVVSMIPIRLSTLAPAEVTAKEPIIVASPMDGVIADINFLPNTYVDKGVTLFALEDTKLRNQFNVTEKTLAIAEAEYRKAKQTSFQDPNSKGQVLFLRAQTNLHKSKLNFAHEMLQKTTVTAESSGLLIYTDKSDWIGKPVQVGERVMEIADPNKIELKINLSVDDAIVLKEGAEVDVFLDADPLHRIKAKVTKASYTTEKYNQDTLSYRIYADFEEIDSEKFRIGLQGTAKIYGDNVSVFFYIFRRPISYLRQLFGL